MRLFEPCIPSPQAWSAILKSARLYRIRGSVADAAIVLRAQDAAVLATALFGESSYDAASERALSPIECDVLDRMVGAIAANLGAICGNREGLGVERVAQIGGFVTYFELLVERPAARIGVALSRDPSPEARGSLELEHLAHVELRTLASLDLGTAQASDVGRLGVGTTLAIDGAVFGRCLLSAHGRRIARGSCGVAGGRFAMVVEAMREAM